MKKTTRFLAIVLAVVLALSCFCTAFAGKPGGSSDKKGSKIELGIINIELPSINLGFENIDKTIDLEDLFKSDLKKFGDAFMEAFLPGGTASIGTQLGEALGGFISNPLEGLEELVENIGNLQEIGELLGGLIGGGE